MQNLREEHKKDCVEENSSNHRREKKMKNEDIEGKGMEDSTDRTYVYRKHFYFLEVIAGS